MKKTLQKLSLLMLAILFAGTTIMNAGSPRMTLLEHMTNASCGPCAAYNPGYQDLLMERLNDDIIPITYRAWYPGSDVMYSQNSAMHQNRVQYYGTPGVPNVRVQGTFNTNPASLSAISSEIDKYLGTTSPITIDVESTLSGSNLDFKVTVSSDEDLTNKTLRIAVVEYHHFYDAAGSNGEQDFYFIVREMFPNASGQSISLTAAESKDFEYSYSINASMYNKDQMYVVAFIQDDASKAVLQAGTSFKSSMPSIMTDVIYDKTDPNKILSKEIVISNPTDKSIEYTLSVNENNMTTWVTGWTVEITPQKVVVPAGQTKQALVNIRSTSTAGLFWVEINATGNAEGYINLPGKLVLYVLSNNAKNVFYGWTSNSFSLVYNDYMQLGAFSNNSALMPIGLMQYYDPTNFDLGIFTVDYWNGGVIGASASTTAAINAMIDAGKDILVTGERELYYSESQYGTQQAMQFFRGNLGISLGGRDLRVSVNSQGYITGILPFSLKGVNTDPISNQLNVQANAWADMNNDPYLVQTDYITLLPGSESKPFLYADDDETKTMGVRWEKGTTRLVYMTLGFNGFANQAQRSAFLSKVLVWLTTQSIAGPELATNKTAVNFGIVDLDQSREMEFDIVNNGATTTDLVIDEVSFSGDDAAAFEFVGLDNNITLPVGESYTVTVKFTPTEEKQYNANVVIKADNSVDKKEVSVSLVGEGIDPSSVAELNDGTFSISALPNPFETVARIEYNAAYGLNGNVHIFVVDATGKVISTLVNSTVSAGTHSVEFNGANLASGTYYVIAQVNGESLRIPLILTK
jgi:hypothetical protein